MIESLTIKDVSDSTMPWLKGIDYFKRNPTTTFKPGLNVLFGANGSGKSTVLQLLGQHLAATQGGVSTVTQSWLTDLFRFSDKCGLPCDVVHDGQPVMYFDARAKEGLIGGAFDDDFFDMGIFNTMAKGSTGQLGLRRLNRMLAVLAKARESKADPEAQGDAPKKPAAKKAAKKSAPAAKTTSRTAKSFERKSAPPAKEEGVFPAAVDWRLKMGGVNDLWGKRLKIAQEMLSGRIAVGPKTMILDEPESGFSLPWQAGLWTNLLGTVDPSKFQLIVATHCPFALGIPGVNYIEMNPGYMTESQLALISLHGRLVQTTAAGA